MKTEREGDVLKANKMMNEEGLKKEKECNDQCINVPILEIQTY